MRIIFFGDSLTEGTIGASYFELLKVKFPNYKMFNSGRNGEPVVGLYKRIKKMKFEGKFDIVFIWIGTNDIFVNLSKLLSVIKAVSNKPWAKNYEEFNNYYCKILDIISPNAKQVFTVSLLFLGENLDNKWNKKLAELSEIIRKCTKSYNNCKYIDMRKEFNLYLTTESSDYLVNSPTSLLIDHVSLQNIKQVDDISIKRGLKFTFDGVHLNSTGAKIAAEIFEKEILKFSNIKK